MNSEEIKGYILFIFFIFVSFKIIEGFTSGGTNLPPIEPDKFDGNSISDEKMKLLKQLDNENFILENYNIDYDDIQGMITKLDIESSSNLEIEGGNDIKIRRLEQKMKGILIKIEDRKSKIYSINEKIIGMK